MIHKSNDSLKWLRELLQLQPYGDSGLDKAGQGFQNVWSLLFCISVLSFGGLWFHFGMLVFSNIAISIFFAVLVPFFLGSLDVLNFRKDEERTPKSVNRGRVALAFIFTLFSFQVLALSFFHTDILTMQRTLLVERANAKIAEKWDPQLKTAEANLAVENAKLEQDRKTLKARQKQELDQVLAAEKAAMDAVQKNALSATSNANLRGRALQKAVDAQRANIESMQKKHAEEMLAFDKNAPARSAAEDIVVNLRAKKAEESRLVLQKPQADIEKHYGVVAKDGIIDQAGILYVDLPEAKGASVWGILFACFIIVFLLELGPFFARSFAPASLADYYKQPYQDKLASARDTAYAEICNAGAPVMEAISAWRRSVDEAIATKGAPTLEAFNELLRQGWVEHVDPKVTKLYNLSAGKGDAGAELLARFLAAHGHTDLRYETRPWRVDAQSAAEKWQWSPSTVTQTPPRF